MRCAGRTRAERAAIAIYMYGLQSWRELDLCRDAAIDINRARQLIVELVASGTVIEVSIKPRGTFCVHHEALKEAEERILKHSKSTPRSMAASSFDSAGSSCLELPIVA